MSKDSIIVKKIKKSAAGHHGGAWKVAYADFVTAMMAFFLLLWLLNATEAENLAGLADYFAPTVGVKDEMGIGFRGGKAILSEGIGADKNTNKGIVFGGVPTGPITKVTEVIEERTDQDQNEQVQIIINQVNTEKKGSEDNQKDISSPPAPTTPEQKQESQESQKTEQALNNFVEDMVKNKRIDEGSVEIKRTPEGLVVEIKDVTGDVMFEKDGAEMKQKLKDALVELSKIIRNIPNNFAIVGHTSSAPIQSKAAGYTKWELSADRANSSRAFLEKNGIQPEQISRIEGRADNVPYDKRKPESPVNNRIDIIILDKNDTPGHKKAAPDSLLIDVRGEQSKKFIQETDKPKEETPNPENKDQKGDQPIQNNIDVKKVLEESESTNIQEQIKKTKMSPEDMKPNPDVIDLKIDKNKSSMQKTKPESKDNEAAKKILDESANTQEQAKKAKISPADRKPAEIIDLKVNRTPVQKESEIKKSGESINEAAKKILDESADTQENAQKAKIVPVDSKPADIIDLNVNRAPIDAAVKKVDDSINETARKLLEESEKTQKDAEKAISQPSKNKKDDNSNAIIDLSVDKKPMVTEEPKKSGEQENEMFKNIMDEISKPKKVETPDN